MKWKNAFMFVLVILTGAVVGSLIAQLVQGIPWLEWLAYGASFGLSTANPVVLDLAVIKLVFGCMVEINIATIIGIVAALLLYRKLV
ncbi:MAG: DUF4321 domain-containing protein [Clostridiaceae bacterium]|nr:DUF4321 domain-containing protein [Clostridiales bacterium]MDD6876180.1 DUF4321 domain-containing protein [Clostridiaceae bacterium]MDY3071906.1 DUF4321 domain-containing protein [Eubacteriales bacterium]MDY3287018.1 DUF4321 domain-containing protein [Eubacteriales bacterium]MDY5016659.1 DUF4321 domain-containing protein [Eubacteriales bacterium]